MKKHTILFLADPIGTTRFALDQEVRAIQVELERSGERDRFELVTRWAAQPLDLLRALRKLKPTVVQFSGFGCRGEPCNSQPDDVPRRTVVDGSDSRDGESRHGLYFQGADGRPQFVSIAALEEAFGAAGASVRVIVLGGCCSEMQAQALLNYVDCVVALHGSMHRDAARSFAIGFYGGLGELESVGTAFRQGCAAISLEGLRYGARPRLNVRDGVDAERLVLAEFRAESMSALNAQHEMDLVEKITRMNLADLVGLRGLLERSFKKTLMLA